MNAISKKLKDGIVKTVKIEGVGVTIGYIICCLLFLSIGLEPLKTLYIFVILTFGSLLIFIAWTVFVIMLNEHYEVKWLLRSDIVD